MMRFVYEAASRSGFDPFLAYNIVPGVRGRQELTTLGRLAARAPLGVVEETFEGMRGVGIERRFPEAEFLNYRGNRRLWDEVLRRADACFAVGGNSHAALPLAYANRPFALWVATPLLEDRIDRIRHQRVPRKLRDYASLPLLLQQERFVYEKASHVLALSEYTRRLLAGKYPFLEGKMTIASFPIDTERFRPVPFAEKSGDYLLFTGRFDDERKNMPLLLRAFREIAPRHPRLTLRLVGATATDSMRETMRAYGIESRVETYPFLSRDELVRHYQHAALFVIASFQEGLCISGLEALSCGTPVISTRCGGPEELLRSGENGWLVPNDDAPALRDAILRFLELEAAGRERMGLAARAYVEQHHHADVIWPKFLAAIEGADPGAAAAS